MKRLRLKNTLEENIQVFGICSTEKIYKICWEINQAIDFQFVNIDSHKVRDKGTDFEHILYQYVDDEHEIRYYVVQNKTLYNFLSVKYKVVDYFFISISDCENQSFDKIKQRCKNINPIRLVLDVDYHKLKKKDDFHINCQ